jgi:hypothetical protein
MIDMLLYPVPRSWPLKLYRTVLAPNMAEHATLVALLDPSTHHRAPLAHARLAIF